MKKHTTVNVLTAILACITISLSAQVSINTDNSAPDPSAMLEVKSTSKGMLVPKMTSTQRTAISNPAEGLLVFDITTHSFWFYKNSAWSELAAGTVGWGLTGNSGTDPSINFIGTSDNVSLIFRANNLKSGWIDLPMQNTSFGYTALGLNTTGLNNTASGTAALFGNTTGSNNTAMGENALSSSTGASNNTAIGRRALYYSNGGDDNAAVGSEAMYFTSSGWGNSSLGRASLYTNTSGYMNTGIGYYATYFNSTSRHNTGIGAYSLYMNSTGQYNTATGSYSLEYNTAYSNTASGFQSIMNNNSGSENSVFGAEALAQNTTGSGNVAMGYSAGFFETGSNKLYIDNRKHSNESDGRSKALVYGIFDNDPANQKLTLNANVGVGTTNPLNKLHVVSTSNPLRMEGLQTTTNPDVLVVDVNGVVSKRSGGFGSAWSLTGNNGTNPSTNFIGTADSVSLSFRINNKRAGWLDINGKNAAFGYKTLYSNTTGSGNIAIGSLSLYSNLDGTSNTSAGHWSMFSNTSGSYNTAYGAYALYSNLSGQLNTAIGEQALASNTTGSSNVAIGNYAGFSETGSNKLYIDNQSRGSLQEGRDRSLIYGEFDVNPSNQKVNMNANVGINLAGNGGGLTVGPTGANIAEIKVFTGTLPLGEPESGAPDAWVNYLIDLSTQTPDWIAEKWTVISIEILSGLNGYWYTNSMHGRLFCSWHWNHSIVIGIQDGQEYNWVGQPYKITVIRYN